MPVEHSALPEGASAAPRHVRKYAVLIGFVVTLVTLLALGQIVDLGGLLT